MGDPKNRVKITLTLFILIEFIINLIKTLILLSSTVIPRFCKQ